MNEDNGMAKTVTVRMDDQVYDLIRKAAHGERKSISSFLQHAALRYLTDAMSVSDEEMDDILSDATLVASLRQGLADVETGRYRVVE